MQFGGGCNGCSMVDVTLKEGIEKQLLAEFPELKGVGNQPNTSAASTLTTNASTCRVSVGPLRRIRAVHPGVDAGWQRNRVIRPTTLHFSACFLQRIPLII